MKTTSYIERFSVTNLKSVTFVDILTEDISRHQRGRKLRHWRSKVSEDGLFSSCFFVTVVQQQNIDKTFKLVTEDILSIY